MMTCAPVFRLAYWERTESERKNLQNELEAGDFSLDHETIFIMENYNESIRSNYLDQADFVSMGYSKKGEAMNYWFLIPRQ